MKMLFPAGLMTAAVLAASAPAAAAETETGFTTTASVVAPQANPLAQPPAVAEAEAEYMDPRFAPYCLTDTGSVIVAMQNRRAERYARAHGTTPKLRCTGTGVALKVNPDGVPVPDQGPMTQTR